MTMMAQIVRELAAAGLDASAIADAIERIEASGAPVRSKGADRTARWRERKEASQTVTVTPGDAKEIPPTPPKENNSVQVPTEPSLPRKRGRKNQTVAPEGFSEFWAVYPRRDDKLDAVKAWLRAVNLSSMPDIVAAAKRYAEECRDKEKRFVKLPATWLNKGSWLNYEPTAPPEAGQDYVRIHSGTDQWDAWLAHMEAKGEKTRFIRNKGEWHVPTEWPPEEQAA